MYVLGTGCQWRDIPKNLPPRSTVHGYSTAGTTTGRWIGSIMCVTWNAVSEMDEQSVRQPR